jgi:hypothetical protein
MRVFIKIGGQSDILIHFEYIVSNLIEDPQLF